MDGVAEDGVFEQGLEGLAIDDIGGGSEEFGNIELEAGVFEEAHGEGRVEIHEYVDVAIRTGFAAGEGAEDRGVADALVVQVGLVSLQGLQNLCK